MCGHGRGNRAPCAGRAICASFAPLAVYIYGFGGESCATRLTLLRSVPLGPTKLRLCLKALFLGAFRSAFGLAPQNAPRFSAVTRPEPWPRMAPLVEFGAVLGVSASLPLPAPPLPSSSRRYAPQCFVGGYASSPCDVSHRASDEPRRCMSLSSALAPSSLASPSIRRVCLRSICARRCPIGSLNLVRGESSAWLILVRHVRYNIPQNRCYCGKWQKATKCKKRNAKGVFPHLIEL